jgi:hypothetical protein
VVASSLLLLWGLTRTEAAWTNVVDPSQCQVPAVITSGFIFGTNGDQFYTDKFTFTGKADARIGIALYRASAVPVPAAAGLFGLALIGLLGFKQKNNRN